jgi:hypothetical protein
VKTDSLPPEKYTSAVTIVTSTPTCTVAKRSGSRVRPISRAEMIVARNAAATVQ